MSPAKRRRRLPTVIDRGLGLLEVVLPRGASESEGTSLPPGQRDESGFWFPAGYDKPGDIFSPVQRELQENQRRIQRRRIQASAAAYAPVGGDGTMTVHGSAGEAHAPPADRPRPRPDDSPDPRGKGDSPGSCEVPVPLPAPLPEACTPRPRAPARHSPLRAPRALSDPESPLLPNADVTASRSRVVDSREGSD